MPPLVYLFHKTYLTVVYLICEEELSWLALNATPQRRWRVLCKFRNKFLSQSIYLKSLKVKSWLLHFILFKYVKGRIVLLEKYSFRKWETFTSQVIIFALSQVQQLWEIPEVFAAK